MGSVMGPRHDRVTVIRQVVDSIPIRGYEIFINFIFHSGVEAKRGNAIEFSEKWESECFNTRFPLFTLSA